MKMQRVLMVVVLAAAMMCGRIAAAQEEGPRGEGAKGQTEEAVQEAEKPRPPEPGLEKEEPKETPAEPAKEPGEPTKETTEPTKEPSEPKENPETTPPKVPSGELPWKRPVPRLPSGLK